MDISPEVNHPGIRSRPRGLKEAVKALPRGGGGRAAPQNGTGQMRWPWWVVYACVMWESWRSLDWKATKWFCVVISNLRFWQVSEDALAIHKRLNDHSGEVWAWAYLFDPWTSLIWTASRDSRQTERWWIVGFIWIILQSQFDCLCRLAECSGFSTLICWALSLRDTNRCIKQLLNIFLQGMDGT